MESKLLINDKNVVIPGDLISTGDDFLPSNGTYKESGEVRSKIFGIVRLKSDHMISVIPLSGQYLPSVGDGVIGEISDVNPSSWMVNVMGPYTGFLSLSDAVDEFVDLQKTDITRYFDVGDIVYTKISSVSKRKDVKLSMRDRMCRKLEGGNIIRISPSKVPRLIGTGGSMIELIKSKTACHIIVGQNGLVWLKGGDMSKASEAVYMIEKESHKPGLTEKISELLGGNDVKE